MKANELRIGNYINDEETTHIIVGVDNYYVRSYWLNDLNTETLYETKIQYIKPIPLTKEWLLKFGFRGCIDAYSINICFINGVTRIYYDLEDNILMLDMADIKILYVHQLQNLYFALTGKELTLTTKLK